MFYEELLRISRALLLKSLMGDQVEKTVDLQVQLYLIEGFIN
jgi:hypothetical protein